MTTEEETYIWPILLGFAKNIDCSGNMKFITTNTDAVICISIFPIVLNKNGERAPDNNFAYGYFELLEREMTKDVRRYLFIATLLERCLFYDGDLDSKSPIDKHVSHIASLYTKDKLRVLCKIADGFFIYPFPFTAVIILGRLTDALVAKFGEKFQPERPADMQCRIRRFVTPELAKMNRERRDSGEKSPLPWFGYIIPPAHIDINALDSFLSRFLRYDFIVGMRNIITNS